MLQDSEGRIRKFINQINGGIDIEQVVIRDFLTVNLVEHGIDISIEITFLMRVFTIAQSLLVIGGLTESRPFFTIEIVEDSRIVMRRYGKGFLSKPTAFFERSSGAMLHQYIAKRLVLGLGSNDNNVIVILGCGTNQ